MFEKSPAVGAASPGVRMFATAVVMVGAAVSDIGPVAAEGVIEEVVVTGTHIRRGDSFDTATPIDVMDSVAIGEQGVTNLGEAVRNQTFQYGVDTVSNVLGQVLGGTNFQNGTNSNANLYGLGENSTLTLMNGRRTESTNLQTMYPKIMVERIETLTDGAATAYGTDAVAGVVNVIPRTDFEGLAFEYGFNNDGFDNDWNEHVISAMLGTGNDRTRLTAAVEYRDRSRLTYGERREFLDAQLSTSSTGNPGTWLVPSRNPDGSLTGASQQLLDPGCGVNRRPGAPQDPTARERSDYLSNPTGIASELIGRCLYDFGATINYSDPQEVITGVMAFEHEFTEGLRFSGEMLFARQDVRGGGGDSPTDPGGRLGELPIVPGHHPGNPYRAMVDNDGDGTLDTPLFAQDLDGDGIPDRDADNQVILAADPFDPASGIAFAEDVQAISWRQQAKLACLEHTPDDPRIRDECSGELAFFTTDQFRVAGKLQYDIPDTTWTVSLDALWHQVDNHTFETQSASTSGIKSGLVGELDIPQSDARWFNPFSTQAYTCTDRDCSGRNQQTDFDQLNHTEIWQRIQQDGANSIITELNVWELIATGDVFELPTGPVGAAFGVQRRYREVDSDAPQTSNARDEFVNIVSGDYVESRETLDYFAEFQIPLFNNDTIGVGDLNLSGRYTDSDDDSNADLQEEIFKAAVRWEPRPWIAMRASAGEAFIAPSIEALFQPPTFQVGNVSDVLLGGTTAFIAQGAGGNPNLGPETSEQFNIGFTARFLNDDLTVSADWKQIKFEDRIARSAVQDVIQDSVVAFSEACQPIDGICTGHSAFANLPVEDGRSPGEPGFDARELFLRNNPAQPGADPSIPGESGLISRNPTTLSIESVVTPLRNLAEMKWEGLDFNVSYSFEGSRLPFVESEIGLFTVGVQGTWVQTFEVQEGEGAPTVDGVGKRNQPSGFLPPIPEIRTTSRVNWLMGRHSLTVLGRHNSDMDEDDAICGLPGVVLAELGATPEGCPSQVPSKMLVDLNYRLELDGLFGMFNSRQASVEIGAINVFDTLPPATAALGSIETFIFDPRGRQLYLRLRAEM